MVTNLKCLEALEGAFNLPGTSESMDGKDGKGKDKDVPRYRSFEGFSTYTKKSILGVQVAQLGSGRIFGELALQNTKPRAATIKCAEDSAFLRIPYATYQGVVKEIFDEARAVEESIRILKTSAFFRDLERNSPGLIKELASRGCTKIEERREQVLFRQFDPPNNCYILLEGSVDVFIYKKTRDKSASLLRKDDQPTPRGQEPIDKKTTITEAANMWKQQREAEKANKLRPVNKKDKNRKFEPWPGEFTRYKTTEGFSTFAKDSKYGKLVTTLKPGAVVGELGLRNNEPRAATIRCAENCKFLVVGKNIFLEVLKVFPPDFDFMIEGIVAAEPAAYLIREGTVRFQRHKYAGENWVYAHRNAPLRGSRLPDLPAYHQYSTSSMRNRRILELQGHASLVSANFRTQLPESGDESPKFSKLGNDLARPQTGAPKETRLVTCDVIKEPNLFCSMPFLPLPVAEPFSV
ncbi:PKAR, partial [Symbiodinium sp. CCMP2456]